MVIRMERGSKKVQWTKPVWLGAAPDIPICGDVDMRIDRNGQWFYHGSPIGRKEMVCLFASVLQRRPDGSYWLVTPAEQARISVDDVPFMAVELFCAGSGRDTILSVRTNVDEIVTIDDDHTLRIGACPETGAPLPYVMVRDGLEARLARAVYYELVALGGEERVNGKDVYGVWSNGSFFSLGHLDPA